MAIVKLLRQALNANLTFSEKSQINSLLMLHNALKKKQHQTKYNYSRQEKRKNKIRAEIIYVITREDLELRTTNEREHVAFASMALGYLI